MYNISVYEPVKFQIKSLSALLRKTAKTLEGYFILLHSLRAGYEQHTHTYIFWHRINFNRVIIYKFTHFPFTSFSFIGDTRFEPMTFGLLFGDAILSA